MGSLSGVRVTAMIGLMGAVCTGPSYAQTAASAPQAATPAITKVTADLAAATFDRVLPFDVPFFIAGTAPDGTVQLFVQYVESRTRDMASPSAWRPAQPAVWAPDAPATANQQFVVFMRDTLEAERYFRFRFTFVRQPSPDQARRFRDDARALFDARLALITDSAVPLTDARQIRDDLAAIVRAVAGSSMWQAAPGSTFDTNDFSAAAMVRFLEGASAVLGSQVARAQVLSGFVTVRLLLHQALANLKANAALERAVAEARKLNNSGLNELLKLDSDGISLLALTPLQLDLVAAGGVTGDLVTEWRPDGPAARAANYSQLVRQLQQLEHFARAVSDAGGAARSLLEPVIGAAAVGEVGSLLGQGGAIPDALDHAQRLHFDMMQLATSLKDRDAGIVSLTERIVLLLHDERFIEGTSVADGATTQNNYISADGGLLYAGDIGQAAVFVGTNIYLRPVNKDAPLSQKGTLSRRFAFTVGLTGSSVADENNRTRSDLFGNSGLVLGAGLRVTQSIRVGAGALVFKESDPNPLVTRKSVATTWYTSFSFDINVAKGLQGLGGEFK